MAYRPRKVSEAATAARTRLAAMLEIDRKTGKTINYGDEEVPITSVIIAEKAKLIEDGILTHNQTLSKADAENNALDDAEAALSRMLTDVLASAKRKFGHDSSEVEQLGGTRTSDRQAPGSGDTPPPPTPPVK